MRSKNAQSSHKGSGDIVNSFIIILAILVVMLVAVATFVGSVTKRERIIFDEVELMRAKNTFYLMNRSVGMTWFISTVQTIFKAENGIGEEYWYKTDPAIAKSVALPDSSMCNSGNPRICLPRNIDISNFLKGEMQNYLKIKGSDQSDVKSLDLNGVTAKIQSINIDKPENFWVSHDRITSIITQKLTAEFGNARAEGTTDNENVIFTQFRKMVTGGWLLVDFAIKFSEEAGQSGFDYPDSSLVINDDNSNYKYISQKTSIIRSKMNEISDWLKPDIFAVPSLKKIELSVPTGSERSALNPKSGLILYYELDSKMSEDFIEKPPLTSTCSPIQYSDIIDSAIKSKQWKFGCPPAGNCRISYTTDEIKAIVASIIQQESTWNPYVISHAGSIGLMQIHPPSHPDCGTAEQLKDPRTNIECGINYFYGLLDAFSDKGDKENVRNIALAAYNCGQGCVEDRITKANSDSWNNIKPFFSAETQNYVPAVVGCIGFYSSATEVSCPIGNPTISCGSYGSGHPYCEHCNTNKGYPVACNPDSMRAKAIDVIGTDGSDSYQVKLPRINGKDVNWNFRAEFPIPDDAGNSGAWGYGKVFTATADSSKYDITLIHLRSGEPSFGIGQTAGSGTVAGRLFDSLDSAGKGHVHIRIEKNGILVRNPEKELGLCSSGPGFTPSAPFASVAPTATALSKDIYYFYNESRNTFEKKPFSLNVKISDYIPVLDCSESNGNRYNWITEKDMLCYGNEIYACQDLAYPATTRDVNDMDNAHKKQRGDNLGVYQCVTKCDNPDPSQCLPMFCMEHVDGINPNQKYRQCCTNWEWGDGLVSVWKGKTETTDNNGNSVILADSRCNGNTFCAGDAVTDKTLGEVCDFRNAGVGSGKAQWCDGPFLRNCKKGSEWNACSSDPESYDALNAAYDRGTCKLDCDSTIAPLCDGSVPGAACASGAEICGSDCKAQRCGTDNWVDEYQCNSDIRQRKWIINKCDVGSHSGCWQDYEWRDIESCPRGGCSQSTSCAGSTKVTTTTCDAGCNNGGCATDSSESRSDCQYGCSGGECNSPPPPITGPLPAP